MKMKIKSIELLSFGLLVTGEEEIIPSDDSPTGYTLWPQEYEFIKETATPKGVEGLKFGNEYMVNGFTEVNSPVTFLCRIFHPTMIHPITQEQLKQITEVKKNYLNQIDFDFYSYEYDWEVVTGRWTFEVIEEERTLLKQEFFIE